MTEPLREIVEIKMGTKEFDSLYRDVIKGPDFIDQKFIEDSISFFEKHRHDADK